MKTLTILFAFSAFMFTGCFPQAVVLWSPDGQHGAVMAQNKIYFCDPSGKLAAESLPSGGPAAWAPNANDFYYVSRIELKSWTEATKYLDPAKQAQLITQAKDALAKLKPGDMNDEKKNPFAKFDTADIILMLLYLQDNQATELKAKLDPKQQKDFLSNKIAASLYQLNVCKNCDWRNPQMIMQTFSEIGGELRPSPNGKAIAVILQDKHPIYICDMKGKLTPVAENVAMFPDWTPDGNSLVYSSTETKGNNSSQLTLGSIKRVKIFNERGEILEKFPVAEELAGVLFHETCQIRCLKNGWIIFSSTELKLPTTKNQMPQGQSLFAIIPDLPSNVINIIPQDVRRYIGDIQWDTFQLSPDQKRIAILVDNNNVAVFDFATAKADKFPVTLQNMENFLPTWQNKDTLCLLSSVQNDSGKMDVKVVLQSANSQKIISSAWPEDVIKAITDKYRKNKEEKQQPATTQSVTSQPATATTKPAK